MYEIARYQVWSVIEELVLAKTALLLSLWCSPKMELSVNSLWVDRAITHTNAYRSRATPDSSNPMPKRCNILYWCCVARNALISYAMRRPTRLYMEEEPLCDPEEIRPEFEREILFHNFSSPNAKLRMVEDFVTLCKLSKNLRVILGSQRPMKSPATTYSDPMQSAVDGSEVELHDYISQYLEVANSESELMDLIENYEEKCNSMEDIGDENPAEVISGKMRSYALNIMTL